MKYAAIPRSSERERDRDKNQIYNIHGNLPGVTYTVNAFTLSCLVFFGNAMNRSHIWNFIEKKTKRSITKSLIIFSFLCEFQLFVKIRIIIIGDYVVLLLLFGMIQHVSWCVVRWVAPIFFPNYFGFSPKWQIGNSRDTESDMYAQPENECTQSTPSSKYTRGSWIAVKVNSSCWMFCLS